MTFEEWLGQKYDACKGPGDRQLLRIETPDLKLAWNAAINAAIERLEGGYYYYSEEDRTRRVLLNMDTKATRFPFAEDELKDLLAKRVSS